MTIQAQYTDEAHTQIKVVLEAGDVLGNFAGPIEFFVGMAPGNKEHDELELLVAEGRMAVADYVPPPPPFINEISDRQFFQQLAIDGEITQGEALDAVKTGAIPAALQAVIDKLPDAQKFTVEMLVSGATKFEYTNPFTSILAQALGRTEAQMKTLWSNAAAL